MKIASLLLAIGMIALGTGRAGAADGDAQPADTQGNVRPAKAKGSPRAHAPMAKPVRAGRGPEGMSKPAANPANAFSSAHPQAGIAVGSTQNEAIYRALPVRPGSVVRPAAPSASPIRHRDANAAMIGGAASPNSRNTGSLDGARTNLRSSRN